MVYNESIFILLRKICEGQGISKYINLPVAVSIVFYGV